MTMVRYDAEVDAMYVEFDRPEGPIETDRIDERRLVDYDEHEQPVGVEFLFVRKGLNLDGIPRADEVRAALRQFMDAVRPACAD
jgi:uncharacterized protein YuzE